MITRFGNLFAGHVDLDNLGFRGTPTNDRSYSNEYLATVYDKTEAIATLMDRTGYDTFWMAEHHFQREGTECIPNILLLSVHLAHLTERIRFGCGFNITPMWHPLRLAEDFATADILTGGRVIFGVGRGYHTREVEVFGAPMLDGMRTATCSRSRSTSSSSRSTRRRSPTTASTTTCRRGCRTGDTSWRRSRSSPVQ